MKYFKAKQMLFAGLVKIVLLVFLFIPILSLADAGSCKDLFLSSSANLPPSQKIGLYSRISIGFTEANLNIVSDANAEWLRRSVELKIGKSLELITQNDVKAFLLSIENADLSTLLVPRLHAYRGVDRNVSRDQETYYLEELIAEGKRKDLSLAIIGQLLLENFAKKDSRIVKVNDSGKPKFAILINGKIPELLRVIKCEGADCEKSFSAVAMNMTPKPNPPAKDQKQFYIYDMKGIVHTLNVVGRSPLERMIKNDQEQFENAGADDLVVVESLFVAQHRPTGSTAFRIGDTIYHFGGDGWGIYKGSEKIKGFLVSNPYLKNNAKLYESLRVPGFNIGVAMMVPKSHVEQFIKEILDELARPADQRVKFDYYKTNCNHIPLCLFRDAGIPMGNPTGISGFSTSATARDLFLNPKYPVRSQNVYPLAGVDLTENQMRDLFPPLLYRFHTLKHDGALLNIGEKDETAWKVAHVLNSIHKNVGMPVENLFANLQESGIVTSMEAFNFLLNQAFEDKLITSLRDPNLTELGNKVLVNGKLNYKLN
jgi:hypothetical protein